MQTKEISDLGLITGLVTLGYSPLERKKEGRRVIYVFESDDHFEQLCEDYFNNRMDVDAQRFHTTMKSIKSSIYQLTEGQ